MHRLRGTATAAAALALGVGLPALGQTGSPDRGAIRSEVALTRHATGTFDVTLTAQATGDTALGRMTIDKRFHGDLEGTSAGEMLSASTGVKGSAGYVAMEHVTGTLHGRRGTFVLQHSGTMTRGEPRLVITVVPDSGTGELAGLAGTMTIDVASGRHSYAFNYSLGAGR